MAERGIVTTGCRLLWRRQGILWWVFAVNFVCGALGTAPAIRQLGRVLHHSLAGEPLSKGFDLGMFVELMRLPSVNLMRSTASSYLFAFVFFVFLLFVSGGILETYRQDRRLSTGDFFAASGAFFWRFVRLMLLSIIPFVVVGAIYQGLDKLSEYVGDKAVADQVGIFSWWASIAVFLLLALAVRLWFDVAQVRAVARNERGMWRNLWKAYRITGRDLGRLFWAYFRISLFAWVTLMVGLAIWAHLPPTATPVTFVLLELILLTQLMTRFWQLASATTWYGRHAEMVLADSAGQSPAPAEEVMEVTEPLIVPGPDLPQLDEPQAPPPEV
jgi:hypothetical protein